MARKHLASARRTPAQERSRAMVDVLVQATTRVLLKEGYEACTTNRVAQEAGVSVGSLYQYFPNKESLVLAVMEKHLTQLHETLARHLSEMRSDDLPTVVRGMVRAWLEANQVRPRLHRVLLEQVPRIGAMKRLHELHALYEPMVGAWLEAHHEVLDMPNPGIAAYVIIAAVQGVATRVMLEKPTWVELGMLEQELVKLVLGYLAPHLVPKAKR